MDGDADAFGVMLRAYRRLAGLSQEELAERSGLSVRAIGDLERGRTRWPYRNSVYRLADALDLRQAARVEFVAAAGRRLTHGGSTAKAPESRPTDRIVPRQLPGAVPAFVGRSGQLAMLSELLRQPGGTAVITSIAGIAGVGKTALAVHWAHQVAAQFPDGQLFVNLRGFDPSGTPVRPAEAVGLFLDALGVPADQLPGTLEAQLGLYRSLLVGKRMLVVLDNARDVAQVRPLLPGSPTCRVVVTSRDQLVGLVAVEAAHPLTLDVLTDVEAGQLLRHRMGADRLHADPAAAKRIIISCAHLPLALCVVAARAATRPDLSLAQVAAELSTNPQLDAFTGGGDPVADVRATFSWSYRHLDVGAAHVFRRVGLHPGPDLESHAVAALTSTTVAEAEHTLTALAHGSLVQTIGVARYSMHDLLRGYARELATGQDGEQERHAALTRLFDYYLYTAAIAMDTAFPAERHRRPRIPPASTPVPAFVGEQDALAWLDAERHSLVAITGHTAEHGWPSHTTRLSETLFRYLDTGSHFTTGLVIHEHARHAASQLGDSVAEGKALTCLGIIDGHQSRYQQATDRLKHALALHGEAADQDGQARALNYLGLIHLRQGRHREATSDLHQAVTLFHVVGERTGEAYALSNLGVISRRQGRYQQATAFQQQALAVFREIGDQQGEATVLDRIGLVELAEGRFERAIALQQQALAVFREVGDRQGEATVLARLGLVQVRQDRHVQATASLQQAMVIYREIGDRSALTEVLNGLGEVLLATGHVAEARARFAAALGIATEVDELHEQARAHDGLANAFQASGEQARARRHWRKALRLYTDLDAPEAVQVRARLDPNQ